MTNMGPENTNNTIRITRQWKQKNVFCNEQQYYITFPKMIQLTMLYIYPLQTAHLYGKPFEVLPWQGRIPYPRLQLLF